MISCLLLGLAGAGPAAAWQTAGDELFAQVQARPRDLDRYLYLREQASERNATLQIPARQLLASVQAELGLYDEAVREFPFDNRELSGIAPPSAALNWRPADAAVTIAGLARGRQLLLINEAHHDARGRLLSLQLLPLLRAEGYTHVAIEALDPRDRQLARRGYPIQASGSEYLHEPVYGELVREALRLGFVLVAYESEQSDPARREADQAARIERQVFALEPAAKLFVHAGYAHIDKSSGRLGATPSMAMALQQLSGIEPLSIDQARLRGIGMPGEHGIYADLIARYQPQSAIVLLDPQGHPWSADPHLHDISVILPPPARSTRRPRWLELDGRRGPRGISTEMCQRHLPCLIEARYANESDQAIAADRYVFQGPDQVSSLYLRPGLYRLQASDRAGHVLGRRPLEVVP